MSVNSFIQGETAKDELVRSTINCILPAENNFITFSGVSPFSNDYVCNVPASFDGDVHNSLLELAFKYGAKVMTAGFSNDTRSNPIENSIACRSIENLKWKLNRNYYQELVQRYDYALMKLQNYIETGDGVGENIVQHCWYLAKLDLCYRKGAVPSDVSQFFEYATDDEVDEILDLLYNFRNDFLPRIIKPTSQVVFNKNFGFGEWLISETDCDMIIDNALVDLRIDTTCKYPKTHIQKSLTYLMMTEINRRYETGANDVVIDELVFYNPRYGEIELLYVEDIPIDLYEKTFEKMVIVTQANYKTASKDFNRENAVNRESYTDDYDNSREDYNDNYNQVIPKKSHHIFIKLLIVIIVLSLLAIAFVYCKNLYVENFGDDFSFTSIIDNLFGAIVSCINAKSMLQ